jgi:pimeloyl-ACP methyl ester carboxylesterase
MLTYKQCGESNERSTLVFLHGFCQNNTCFQEQVLFFRNSHNLILIDLPGFGASKQLQATSIAEMANQVIELLNQLNIQRYCLFGHSMGGYVALSVAAKASNQLTGLGLIHSTARADSEERIAKRIQTVDFINKNGLALYIKNFIPGLFTPNANAHQIAAAKERGMDSSEQGVLNAIQAMMTRSDYVSLLPSFPFPVFWAIGKYDELLPEGDLFKQTAACKMAYIAYLKNAAHMGMIEESAALNRHIKTYLQLI